MRIEQRRWTHAAGWSSPGSPGAGRDAQLVLVFAAPAVLREVALLQEITRDFPQATFLGCSTAGEIYGTQVADDTLTLAALRFEHTHIRGVSVSLGATLNSRQAGEALAGQLPAALAMEDGPSPLVHVLVLSDGLKVNGSDLVTGLTGRLAAGVTVTGGLAADGAAFGETLVWTGGNPQPGLVAAVGLYGRRLRVGYGSLGGWDSFGPERLITRSCGSVLYEFDGQSALELYKRYLGEHAAGLPATGLLFPLSLRASREGESVVRTILSVNETEQSMTFAGDVPEGAYARLMKANFDRLIDGAVGAAQTSNQALGGGGAAFALLISCVGRKLVLKQRVEEEVEGVREVLGEAAVLSGFYSYGEISPFTPGAKCELHNQTMTITTLREI